MKWIIETDGLAIVIVAYALISLFTFYYIIGEKTHWALKIGKIFLSVVAPGLGLILIWSEIILSKLIFDGRRP